MWLRGHVERFRRFQAVVRFWARARPKALGASLRLRVLRYAAADLSRGSSLQTHS